MILSIRSSILAFSLATLATLSPAARAEMWSDERYDLSLRSSDSSNFFLQPSSIFLSHAGPAWLMDAMAGPRVTSRHALYIYDTAGDRTASDVPYVQNRMSFAPGDFSIGIPMFLSGRTASMTAISAPLAPTATTYNWTANTTGNDWSISTSWTPNIVGGPDNPGDIAIINNDITAARTITLFLTGDSGNAVKTVGRLDIGDSNGTHAFTITTGSGGGILEFDSGDTSAAQLNNLVTANGTRIGAPIQLKTDLTVTNLSTNGTSNVLTLGGSSAGGITSSATSGTQTLTVTTSAGDVIIGGASTAVVADGATGGKIAIVKDGTGTLQLTTSTNTYSGGTTIKSGTIQYNNNASFGTGTITLGFSGGGNATLQSTNSSSSPTNNITVASGSGGTLTIGSTSAAASGGNVYSGTVLLNGDLTVNSLFTGTGSLQFTNTISGNGALIKTGAGAATLSGANTYAGGTTISAGTLYANNTTGSATGSGAVTVNNTGTLSGNGFINTGANNVTVNGGGTITAGGNGAVGAPAVGTLTLTSNTLTIEGTYLVDINGTTADRITLTGNLDLSSAEILNFNSIAAPTAASYTLVSYTGTLSGIFDTIQNLPSGYAVQYNTGEIDLVAVPEPSTWIGAGLALAAIGFTQRKRLRRSKI